MPDESIFIGDIEEMMFGFGDSWPVDSKASKLVETLVVQFIEDCVTQAAEVSQVRGQLDKECFMFLARKDRPQFLKICKLLESFEELNKIQKVVIDEDQR